MKRKIIVLYLLFCFTSLFALHSIYEEKNVTPDNFEYVLDSLEAGGSYALILEDDFDFSKLNSDFFETRMIQKIHNLFIADTDIKFYGPFDYIYFNDVQNKSYFYDLREYLIDNKDKKICIDFSSSYYSRDYGFLPDNCFADHENLYWVYFGDFLSENIPDGLCKNCRNLIAIYMYNYDKIGKNAFKGCNSKAVIYDMNYNKTLLKNVSKKAEKKENIHKDWDYIAFEDSFPEDFQSEHNEDSLFDNQSENLDEDLEFLISLFINELNWDELGKNLSINKISAKKYRSYKKASSPVVNTTISFLSETFIDSQKAGQYINPEQKNVEIAARGKYKFSDLPSDVVYYVFWDGEYEESIPVGYEFMKDGNLYKDILLIEYKKIDDKMLINAIYTGILRELLLEEIQGTDFQGDF